MFISGYVNTENVFYCLTVIQLDLTLVNFFLSVHYNACGSLVTFLKYDVLKLITLIILLVHVFRCVISCLWPVEFCKLEFDIL